MGFTSPWAAKKARETVANDPLAVAKPGKQPVSVAGRRYQIIVELPVQLPVEHAAPLALHVLGEALAALDGSPQGPLVAGCLLAQKLRLRERLLGPCVTLQLGPLELWAAASSSNETAALAMAVDRLAMALTTAGVRTPLVGSTLRDHFIQIVSVP